MTRWGTSHFVSYRAARSYYQDQCVWLGAFKRKLASGEIHIGKPSLKSGERLVVIDDGRRYAIEEKAND